MRGLLSGVAAGALVVLSVYLAGSVFTHGAISALRSSGFVIGIIADDQGAEK